MKGTKPTHHTWIEQEGQTCYIQFFKINKALKESTLVVGFFLLNRCTCNYVSSYERKCYMFIMLTVQPIYDAPIKVSTCYVGCVLMLVNGFFLIYLVHLHVYGHFNMLEMMWSWVLYIFVFLSKFLRYFSHIKNNRLVYVHLCFYYCSVIIHHCREIANVLLNGGGKIEYLIIQFTVW